MATIDKLTLELNAEGADEFIRSLNEADKALKKIQDDIKKATESTDNFDKKQSQSNRKKSQQQNKDKKASLDQKKTEDKNSKKQKEAYKLVKQTNEQFSKIYKAMLGITGISFGLNALANRSEKAVTQSTELGNESRTLNASAKELESFNTTLTALGYSAGQFSDFLAKLSTTQSSYMYGNVAPDDSIISLVNGIGALTGQTVNLQQDSVLKSMDEIAKAIKSLDKNKLTQLITTFGVDRSLVELFNNNKYAQARKTGDDYARQTEALQERNANRKLALTGSQTALSNQIDILGENFTPVLVKLNQIGTRLLVQVNKLEPEFEKALPQLEKLGKDLINWASNLTNYLKEKGIFGISYDENDADARTRKYLSSHPNLSDGEKDEIIRESRKLVNIDSEKGDVVTKDSHGERSYNKNDFFNARPKYLTNYFDYLVDEKRNEINNKNIVNEKNNETTTSNIVNEKTNEITKDFKRNIVNENNKNSVNEVSKDFTRNIVNEKTTEISKEFTKELVSQDKIKEITGDPLNINPENIKQHNIDAQYRNTQVPSNNATTNINVNEVNINGQQIDTMDKFVDQVSQRATTVTGISHAQAFNSLTNTV